MGKCAFARHLRGRTALPTLRGILSRHVQSLVLYGSFACLLPEDDPASPDFDVPRFLDYVERNWGTGQLLGAFVHAPPAPAILEQLGRYERACASPRLVVEIMRSNLAIDARPILPAISTPALVIHRAGDPIVGIARGRAMATALRNAQFVELAGEMHCGWDAREWAPALDAMEEFLTGTPAADSGIDRILATVLFTDIVESTQVATETGDHLWHDILDRHDSETRRIVARFGGRIVKHTGDGTLATFDSPTRAVHCAPRCATVSVEKAARFAQAFTPGRSSDEGTTLQVLGSISVHASRDWQDRRRFSCRAPCMT